MHVLSSIQNPLLVLLDSCENALPILKAEMAQKRDRFLLSKVVKFNFFKNRN